MGINTNIVTKCQRPPLGKPIPEPVIHLDIPYGVYRELRHREELEQFVVY